MYLFLTTNCTISTCPERLCFTIITSLRGHDCEIITSWEMSGLYVATSQSCEKHTVECSKAASHVCGSVDLIPTTVFILTISGLIGTAVTARKRRLQL